MLGTLQTAFLMYMSFHPYNCPALLSVVLPILQIQKPRPGACHQVIGLKLKFQLPPKLILLNNTLYYLHDDGGDNDEYNMLSTCWMLSNVFATFCLPIL